MNWTLFFKTITILGVLSTWTTHALQDGKITISEVTDLGLKIASILGITVIYNQDTLEE